MSLHWLWAYDEGPLIRCIQHSMTVSLIERVQLPTVVNTTSNVFKACGTAMAFPICLNAMDSLLGRTAICESGNPSRAQNLKGSRKWKVWLSQPRIAKIPLFCKWFTERRCCEEYDAHNVGRGWFGSGHLARRTSSRHGLAGRQLLFTAGNMDMSP